ncbi:MAG: DUF131 domain-containing protein [Thermoplasmatota archaeon]|nr:DUF131 domain-containing protein [Candidatus Thermoplasmatota archaeon]MBU1915291.1 DUF131 domain-containing protein [Candidatus Thermoplasmatota archaeon]
MFVAGVALIATAVATGESNVSLVIVFPVFSGSSLTFLLATLLIISSFIVGFVLMAMDHEWTEERVEAASEGVRSSAPVSRTEYGGVVLLGPIPIAFGSNKRVALIMLVVGVILAIVVLVILLAYG